MQQLSDLGINLAAAVIAFLVGLLWQRTRSATVNYRARKFWRPVMSGDLQLVLGRFRGLTGFEESGVVGAGDALAMNSLQDYFRRIGFNGFQVSLNDQLGFGESTGQSLKTNLILIGGPDANSLTYDVVRRLELGISFKELDPRHPDELLEPRVFDMADLKSQRTLRRTLQAMGLPYGHVWRTPVIVDNGATNHIHQPTTMGEIVLSDCGVIIRAPNPFNPRKNVVILCGCYGYGTWAAVQFCQSDDFLRQIPKGATAVECILGIDVVRDTPQRPQIRLLRDISKPAQHRGE